MNHIVESYENCKEEDRFTTDCARKVEFITTVRVFDELIGKKARILDCAAGTGAYAFYLADQGYQVTATDITPRHVDYMNEVLKTKPYEMKTGVMDATDLSYFPEDSFDVVLNMGPMYHLINLDAREKCMKECLRVLKKGGLLVTAYISKYFIFPYLINQSQTYLNTDLGEKFLGNGVLQHEDRDCFWTDSYYSSAEEMEQFYQEHQLIVVDHFAQDGISTLIRKNINECSESQFQKWCEYHYQTCREKSILGTSNHVIIVGRKE